MAVKGKTMLMLLALAALSLFSVSGFLNTRLFIRELENMELIRTMGIDITEQNGMKLTIAGGVQKTGGGDASRTPLTLTGEGVTVSQIAQTLQTHTDRYIFYGHVSQFLLGERAATVGLRRCLDYWERDLEMRLDTNLYIVKANTAENVMVESTGEHAAPTTRLQALQEDQGLLSQYTPITLGGFLTLLEQNACALCPALSLAEKQEGEKDAQEKTDQKQEKSLILDGYAAIGDFQLLGYLSGDAAKGVKLLLGEIGSDVIPVRTRARDWAALRLLRGDTWYEPEFDGDTLRRVRVRIELYAGLNELQGEANLAGNEEILFLASQLEKIEQQRAEQVIALSQKWRADFLHLEQKVGLAALGHWGMLREEWDRIFPELVFEVEVTGHVEPSYDISHPIAGGNR